VAQLYDFRDHYFEHNGLGSAARKTDDVENELQKTLEIIDKYQGMYMTCLLYFDSKPECFLS